MSNRGTNHTISLVLGVIFLSYIPCIVMGMHADSIFSAYMKKAKEFAIRNPHEKVYLQFDNTGYFAGDTIWFKAYTVISETNKFSSISRPLYVELIDQAGQTKEKQIIRLSNGEGEGQFILPSNIISGYYEIRAYTRWMLQFSKDEYFSKTFPIYKMSNKLNEERSITDLKLCESMRIRPAMEEEVILSFYPEGGHLIQGVESKVAFKVESKQDTDVKANVEIISGNGQKIAKVNTIHNGMGYFTYKPTETTAKAKLYYKNKIYNFNLPEALQYGYAIHAKNDDRELKIITQCNKHTPKDTLAVFISSYGNPIIYKTLYFDNTLKDSMTVKKENLPSGIAKISLINTKGQILSERFVFSYPEELLNINIRGVKPIYTPYSKIKFEFGVRNTRNKPIQGKIPVSIRDGLRSEYSEYENNILTSLLLTSSIKGYVHEPGYYFKDITSEKKNKLDLLMMVQGWRKYENQTILQTDEKEIMPAEKELVINGTVKSSIMKKPLKNIRLSIALKDETGFLTGETLTDENGNFKVPMELFAGNKEALIQTRKQDKNRNTDALIILDRNFAPNIRRLVAPETNPTWEDTENWKLQTEKFDSIYLDSLSRLFGNYILDEIIIKSKRKDYITKIDEQGIDAYYDIRRKVDELRDEGKFVGTIPDFLEMVNPHFFWDRRDNSYTYRQKKIIFLLDGKILSSIEQKMMMTEIDGLESIYITHGSKGISNDLINNSKITDISEALNTNESNSLKISTLDDITKYAFIYLVSIPHKDVLNNNESAATGTRHTTLQGYSNTYEFYSPKYPYKNLYMDRADTRRTLLWKPSAALDKDGRINIECYNNQYSTPIIIQAEILTENGEIGTITYTSIPEK